MSAIYLNLVKEIFSESTSRAPFIQEEDFQIGLQIFTKLAFSSTKNFAKENLRLPDKKIESENESLEGITTKIKEFVKKYSQQFWQVCDTGFPFSILNSKISETALNNTLDSFDSIIVHLIKQDDSVWFTEEELEEKFGEVINRLKFQEVIKACSDLTRAYIRKGDIKAGYFLLWLIKHTSGCNFEIPVKEIFDNSTVRKVLSEFVSSKSSTLKYPINFIKLLHFRDACSDFRGSYLNLLVYNCHSIFLNFTVNQLKSISMAAWPDKGYFITDLLKTVTTEGKMAITQTLESSLDPETAKLGHQILNALKSTSLRAAIPHFYALRMLIPELDDMSFEIIFGRPFNNFRHDCRISNTDPEFTRRLRFNDMKRVFISGDLMIGVRDSHFAFLGVKSVPHLLAYDMKTEKMQWGIPLIPTVPEKLPLNTNHTSMPFSPPQTGPLGYHLSDVGENIILQFLGRQNVYLIDPNSGETKAIIELPYEKNDVSDRLHLTPGGFGYQVVYLEDSAKLIGGKIANSKLDPVFEVETPEGSFLPLSTHVGFFENFENKLILFGPTGKSVTIGCLSAYALDNKIYLVEPNPCDENTCKLTIRTMTTEDRVISDPEKSIIFEAKKVSIQGLCDDGQLILFMNDNYLNNSPIFLNLESEEIVYCKHQTPSHAERVINAATGELWVWDFISKKIWRISSKETTFMGSLNKPGITLLHVDQSNHLYFIS